MPQGEAFQREGAVYWKARWLYRFVLESLGLGSDANLYVRISMLVFWVHLTTKDYIRAENNPKSPSLLLCAYVNHITTAGFFFFFVYDTVKTMKERN